MNGHRHPLRAGTARRARYQAQVVDITERRRADLEAEAERRRTVVLAAGGAITDLDGAKRQLLANACSGERVREFLAALIGALLVAIATWAGWMVVG